MSSSRIWEAQQFGPLGKCLSDKLRPERKYGFEEEDLMRLRFEGLGFLGEQEIAGILSHRLKIVYCWL